MQNNLHYNKPQLRSMLVDAPEEWDILARGTGKSEGILAPKSTRLLNSMPRGIGVMVGATFQQLLTRTLPPVIAGWEKLGYKRDVHFIIGQRPSDRWKKFWKWKGPYRAPLKFEYFISWWNGAGVQMVSQDRIGSSNGMSVDWIMGDEAKLLNWERMNSELLPTNRGVIWDFKDNPHHHGMTFTTDMPVGTAGRQILNKQEQCDPKRVQEILQLQATRYQLHAAGDMRAVAMIDAMLLKLRKGLVFYQEASALENIHALGIDFIRQMSRNLSDFEFRTSILNRRPQKLEDGFYPDLDEERHGYFAFDYHAFEKTGYDFLALSKVDGAGIDSDYDSELPLDLALDYNRRICPAVVGQLRGQELRIINGLHSLYPEKLVDTLRKFCKYYAGHKNKVVRYWYDQTAVSEYAHAGRQCDEVINFLRREGWTVIEMYIGAASGHERRYTMYGHLLKEDDHYPYTLRMNRERCKYLFLSMYQAQAEYRKQGFGKAKKTELDPKFPAEESTHYSEALDMLVFGLLESGLPVSTGAAAGGGGSQIMMM